MPQSQKTPQREIESNLGDILNSFVHSIDALRETLSLSMLMIFAAVKTARERFDEFAQKYGKQIENDEVHTTYTFEQAYGPQASRLAKSAVRSTLGFKLVPRSLVVSLISEFDALLGRFLRALFKVRPDLLSDSERSFTLSELVQLGSVEATIEFILSKEIESVIRKSHAEQFDWLETRFGLPLRKDLASWPTFIELTERRHLFVHNNGVVSAQYLAVCKKHGVDLSGEIHEGTELQVPPDYFSRAHACVFEIGVKLCQVLWRKTIPTDFDAADQNLIRLSYDLLAEERFQLAVMLLDFACTTLKRYGSEQNRRIMVINRAQAYKWLGQADRCISILSSEDWSACSEEFQLAVHVLREDYEQAAESMQRIGDTRVVSESAYEDWPLFREFRKSDLFTCTYEKVFGRSFRNVQKVLQTEEGARQRDMLERFKALSLAPEMDDEIN